MNISLGNTQVRQLHSGGNQEEKWEKVLCWSSCMTTLEHCPLQFGEAPPPMAGGSLGSRWRWCAGCLLGSTPDINSCGMEGKEEGWTEEEGELWSSKASSPTPTGALKPGHLYIYLLCGEGGGLSPMDQSLCADCSRKQQWQGRFLHSWAISKERW